MPENRPPIPNDGIYRTILGVMVATVMIGALLAIAGETALHNPDLSRFGGGVALVGALIYAVFRWLGAQEMKRRTQASRPPEENGDPET